MSVVSAVAITVVKAGHEEYVHKELERLIEPVHREAGVIQYEMHRDLANPRRYVFIERWESREAFEAHVNAPHVVAYREKVEGLLEQADFYALERIK